MELKTKVWEEMNREYLEQQKVKQAAREEAERLAAEEGADDGSAHGAADHAGMVEAEGDCEFRARHCHMYVALHERDGRGAKYKKQWVVLDEGLLLCYNTPPATQSDMTLREVEDDEEEDREVCPGNTLCTAQRLLNELQV